jgi:hypothetical protein
MAQSGEGQYLFVRTADTPRHVDFQKLNDATNDKISDLMLKRGIPFDTATQMVAKENAQKFNMAYYEGKNGVLYKVKK